MSKMSLSALCLGVSAALAAANAEAREFVYVANQDQTVRAFAVDDTSGALVPIPDGEAKTDPFPVTITGSPDGRSVYTVNLNGDDISGFRASGLGGTLTEIPGSPFPFPRLQFHPFGIVVHPSGKFAYVNATAGQVWEYLVDPVSGALTPTGNPARVGVSPSVGIEPRGRFLYAANTFQSSPPPIPVPVAADISAFAINQATGALTEVAGSPLPGTTGPKRVAMDPNGGFVLVANSQKASITTYAINPENGSLKQFTPAIPTDAGSLDIRFEPTGHFVYVTIPTLQRVSVYAFNSPINGGFGLHKVQDVSTGGKPTFLGVDPNGAFLFVMVADTSTAVATYAIDKATGTLSLSAAPVVVAPDLSAVGMTVSNITPVIVGQ